MPEPLRGKVMLQLHLVIRWQHWINNTFQTLCSRAVGSQREDCSTIGAIKTWWTAYIPQPLRGTVPGKFLCTAGRNFSSTTLALRNYGTVTIRSFSFDWGPHRYGCWYAAQVMVYHANCKWYILWMVNFLDRWWRLVGAPYTVLAWSQLWGLLAKRCWNRGELDKIFESLLMWLRYQIVERIFVNCLSLTCTRMHPTCSSLMVRLAMHFRSAFECHSFLWHWDRTVFISARLPLYLMNLTYTCWRTTLYT